MFTHDTGPLPLVYCLYASNSIFLSFLGNPGRDGLRGLHGRPGEKGTKGEVGLSKIGLPGPKGMCELKRESYRYTDEE